MGFLLPILLNNARILRGNLDFSALSGQCVLALLVIHRRSEKFATFLKTRSVPVRAANATGLLVIHRRSAEIPTFPKTRSVPVRAVNAFPTFLKTRSVPVRAANASRERSELPLPRERSELSPSFFA